MWKKILGSALVAIVIFSVSYVAAASENGRANVDELHEMSRVEQLQGGQGAGETTEQQEEQTEREQGRALEEIQAAEEVIAQADSLIDSLSYDPPHAAVVLLDQAKEHLADALEAYDGEKHGEAYGLANAAERLARNAIRIIEDVEEEEENEEEAESEEEDEGDYPSIEENVEQTPAEEDLEQPSIVWVYPSVITQGESTTFYVDMAGDLSEVSVYLESPSGAWSAWRDAIGKTPDGLWYGEIRALNQAEVGTWRITTLYIADRAGNWWYYDTDVAFDVASAGNGELKVNSIWVYPTAVAAGENVAFFVDVTGDLSEVSVYIESPTRAQEGWRDASGKTPEGVWWGWFQVPEGAEEGTWKITIVYVRDEAGNWFYYRTRSESLASFEVSSTGDRLVGIKRIWVSPDGVAQGETVTFYIELTGSPSEVSVYCENPSGSRSAWRDAYGSTSDGVWYGDITIPDDAEIGTWRITAVSISVKDETGNWFGLVSVNTTFEVR